MTNYAKFIELSPEDMATALAEEALRLMENPRSRINPDNMTKQECFEALAKSYYKFFMYDKEEAERLKREEEAREAREARDKLIQEQWQRVREEEEERKRQEEERQKDYLRPCNSYGVGVLESEDDDIVSKRIQQLARCITGYC